MLDKLLDFLNQFAEKLSPFEIIDYYDRGIRLRFGKRRVIKKINWEIKKTKKFGINFPTSIKVRVDKHEESILEPGWHWKIPLADNILTSRIKTKTMDIREQSVTTLDGKSIVVRGVLKYEVANVATLLLEVDSPEEAVMDMCQGIVMKVISEKNWIDCNGSDLSQKITTRIKTEAEQWGIKVSKFTLTDLALMRSIRLLNSK